MRNGKETNIILIAAVKRWNMGNRDIFRSSFSKMDSVKEHG
jgi:hypothetical protein